MITSLIAKQQVIIQFFRYLLSGSIATIVHYVLLITLVELLQINTIVASSAGFIAGAITGFNLNKYLVFNQTKPSKFAYGKYLFLAATNSLINIILLWILTSILTFHYLLAQIIITIAMVIYNFICCKNWIFSKVIYEPTN